MADLGAFGGLGRDRTQLLLSIATESANCAQIAARPSNWRIWALSQIIPIIPHPD
jgi:hypothetical protein